MKPDMKCPRCGSNDTSKILYGLPAFSEELQRKLDKGKVVIGGCCVGPIDPKYHCNACKKDFGTPPVLKSEQGEEPYNGIVQSIHFVDGGFFNGYYDMTIKTIDGVITMEIDAPFKQRYISRTLSSDEWMKIIDTLYDQMHLHEWKKRFVNSEVLDGEQWELDIGLTGDRICKYYGSNAFPPYWTELKKLFEPFLAEARLDF